MKKTITLKNIVFAIFLALPVITNAQDSPKVFGKSITEKANPENGLIRCISTEYEKFLQENSPERANTAQFESWIGNKITERRAAKAGQKSGNAILTIPVVVHVIHNGDAYGVNENISDEQVISQITVLNQDYRRMFDTPGYNEIEEGADTQIEFCLAQIDQFGEPTNGITRENKFQESWGRTEIENTLKFDTQWDPEKYLNIWVCNFGSDLNGILGYAQFPQSSTLQGLSGPYISYNDGVIIGYKYFGSKDLCANGTYQAPYNKGRTATHEVGHFLGLRHIWGDEENGQCNSTDYCNDTPYAAEANYGCMSGIDSCPNKSGSDMVNNYMDYSNDTCMDVFTQNQAERMITVLENAVRRKNLLTSGVCGLATTADFQLLQETNIYPNPTQNELNITVGNGDLPDSYVIYNSIGQVVANVKVSSQASLTINTSGYANGIYIMKVYKGSETKTLKFIKN